jgi:hypothetical protein
MYRYALQHSCSMLICFHMIDDPNSQSKTYMVPIIRYSSKLRKALPPGPFIMSELGPLSSSRSRRPLRLSVGTLEDLWKVLGPGV